MRDKSFYFKNGPNAVLLFHAFSSTPNDVRSLGRALEREGYTVYAPTFSGHNRPHPEEVLEHTPEQWYEDVQDAYQFLKEEGHTSIAAFGLSLGGLMAIRLLLHEPLVGGGIFASPVISDSENNVPKYYWPYFYQQKKEAGMKEEKIKHMQEKWSPKLENILNGLNTMTKEMEPAYSTIRLPIFIAQGGEDEMINPETAFLFAEALTHAQIDLKWYEEGQHAITVGKYGNDLQKDLILFLDRLDWNGGFK